MLILISKTYFLDRNQAKRVQSLYFDGSLAAMITHIGGHFVDPSVMET
jgi:hypothetical protein